MATSAILRNCQWKRVAYELTFLEVRVRVRVRGRVRVALTLTAFLFT